MRLRTVLYLWIIAIIFPFTWFVEQVLQARQFYHQVFEAEWLHILTHALLYAGLAVIYESVLSQPPAKPGISRSAGRLIFLVLLVGTVQEGLQHLTGSTQPGITPSLFDLGVDLVGAALGFALFYRIRLKSWNFLKSPFVKG